ncbi:hypothetical protein AX016_2402 [Cellulophaga sp. RHA19]|uniref:hypothetical protein n=1 Tax=Cellulophaga sp. RHA19 TaxID=1798237 RepID=UPI000C2C49DF|nr:hypothetical protein [Cellulophaga sp. RHA19]PKB44188.1 hypothetical protein AX016_2402 [Cellulophaga sp. RHA19]
MSLYSLYPKLKLTHQDYLDYNTYFVKHTSDRVSKNDIESRLRFIADSYNKKHALLSDEAILAINNRVKKKLKSEKRIFLSFAFAAMVLLYFGIKYLKPVIGVSVYYNVPVVGNNPWEIILVVLIFLCAWWYEKKNYKNKLISGVKNQIIASVETYIASSEYRKQQHSKKQQHKVTKRRRW